MSKGPSSIRRHPPGKGEHTEEVLLELGYSREEISDLKENGVIKQMEDD